MKGFTLIAWIDQSQDRPVPMFDERVKLFIQELDVLVTKFGWKGDVRVSSVGSDDENG